MEKEILEILKRLEDKFDKLESKVDNLETKVEKGFKDTNDRIDNLLTGIKETVVNEVSGELSTQLSDIKTDVKFIKHKLHKTEEDMFAVKDHLHIVK